MGVTFRNGDYVRFVRMGGRTVKDGEAAVVWNNRGVATEVIGPQRIGLYFSTVRFLSRIKANADQYLVVSYCDGRVEHMNGPLAMYLNPLVHSSITVHDGIKVPSKDDCIVVFSSKQLKEGVSKKVDWSDVKFVYGPTVYLPLPGEWIHEFQWQVPSFNIQHSSNGKNRFHILSLTKTHIWKVNLVVRTAELHNVQAKLAITYKVDSAKKVLAAQDPIQLIEPAILHDAQRCSGKEKDIMDWIVTEASFPTFCETLTSVGFRLVKIQLLKVDPSLQAQKALLKDKRAAQALDLSNIDQEVKGMNLINQTKLDYLKGLQELGIDVTQVLVASGGKVDLGADQKLGTKTDQGKVPTVYLTRSMKID